MKKIHCKLCLVAFIAMTVMGPKEREEEGSV